MKLDWNPPKELGFEGKVEIEMFSHPERIRFLGELNLKVGKDGSVEQSDHVHAALKQFEAVKERVKSVELKHLESGQEFKDVESLSFYSEGVEVLNELSVLLMKGISLGKKLEAGLKQ